MGADIDPQTVRGKRLFRIGDEEAIRDIWSADPAISE